jgi:hypothetical protein
MRQGLLSLLFFGSALGCHLDLALPLWPPAKPSCDSEPPGLVDPPAFPAPLVPPADAGFLPNPLPVTQTDPEFLWNQIVDTMDDYFQIASERRIQNDQGYVSEGYLETRAQPGATALEPWNWDSASGDELALASLQSIRRQARVRAIPGPSGYQVYVEVHKELENVDRPAHATPGSATPRHDSSLVRLLDARDKGPVTIGWISLGRDFALEQEILGELQARLSLR